MKGKIFGLVMALLMSSSAYAVVIDFSTFSTGNTGSTTLVTPEATFNSFGDNFYVGAAGMGYEICALNGGNCQMDFEALFNAAIENLTLVTSGWHAGDTVEIFAYDAGNTLLGSVTQAANGLVDLTAFSGITRLFFDDSSTGAGFAYDAFTFDYAAVDVPEPGSLILLVLGMVGLGLSRRRKH